MRKVFKSICLFLIFHFVLCSREDEQMSAHVAAGEQTRHRAVVVQKQWQTPPHWMGIYQPTSYKYAVSCFSPRVCVVEALWRSIPVSRWCVVCHKAEHSQGQWILLSSVECGLTAERGCLDGKTPSTPVHTLWCEQMMSSTDRRECKRCVRVRVCLHMWGINAFHYPLLQTCITHIFYFIWRGVMFHMLLLWRVYMYICAVNKYFLFK